MHSVSPALMDARLDSARASMRVAVAETQERVNDRADAQIAHAARLVRLYEKTVRDLNESLVVPIEDVQGLFEGQGVDIADLSRLRHSLLRLREGHRSFQRNLENCHREHGALFDPSTLQVYARVCEWLENASAIVEKQWLAALERLDSELVEQEREHADVAAEWAAVAGDGLDEEPAPH